MDGTASLLVFNQMLELKGGGKLAGQLQLGLTVTGLGFHVSLLHSTGPSQCFIEGLRNLLKTIIY